MYSLKFVRSNFKRGLGGITARRLNLHAYFVRLGETGAEQNYQSITIYCYTLCVVTRHSLINCP